MSNLVIKDMHIATELDREAMTSVNGGFFKLAARAVSLTEGVLEVATFVAKETIDAAKRQKQADDGPSGEGIPTDWEPPSVSVFGWMH